MKIGITGASGLLGFHLRSFFFKKEGCEVQPVFRTDFEDILVLARSLESCDVVIHLAGVNRGSDQDVYEGNIGIARRLISALEKTRHRPHIIFANSTHIFTQSLYGAAKQECSRILSEWAQKTGATFTDCILPHVFGEFGKPFYNSAISTFCYQLANQQKPKIIDDVYLELVHGYTVAQEFSKIIEQSIPGQVRLSGTKILVSEALSILSAFDRFYGDGIIPKFNSPFELFLFNTYRSYLFPHKYPVNLKLREDERGSLFESVKSFHGGQSFLSTSFPGVTRGNHFHFYKLERFLVVRGEATISIRKLHTNYIHQFQVRGNQPCYIDIPTYHTHSITNTGREELLTLFWSHEIFNPAAPDTYAEMV